MRCEVLQLLPSFLTLPEDPKKPIMDAVGAIIDSFPLTSRERARSTQHTAYISQLMAIFDALCGATDNAHNVTALLDVSWIKDPAHQPCYGLFGTTTCTQIVEHTNLSLHQVP